MLEQLSNYIETPLGSAVFAVVAVLAIVGAGILGGLAIKNITEGR